MQALPAPFVARHEAGHRDHVSIDGARPWGEPRFYMPYDLTLADTTSIYVPVMSRDPFGLAFAHALAGFHTDGLNRAEDVEDRLLMEGGRVRALFRALPDGRREAFVLDSPGPGQVERRVYEPHPDWLESGPGHALAEVA